MAGRQNGTVKWFNDEKGYDFIAPESGPDLYVHLRAIEGHGFKSLKDGQKVSFEAVQGYKGMQADRSARSRRPSGAVTGPYRGQLIGWPRCGPAVLLRCDLGRGSA
ncbi:hypothetical protein GCM10010341_77820 [Streptomyces noursei]|nr:hypothetical protein GCM10010341_77820 [Streptomyces noursei]